VTVDGSTLPDGTYTVVVRAVGDDGTEVESDVALTVSRLLGAVTVRPLAFSPNGDGRSDRLRIGFALAAAATVRIDVSSAGAVVATPLEASFPAGPQTFVWDGTVGAGTVPDGSYTAMVEASNETGAASFAVPFAVDTVAPAVRIVSLRPLEVSVSEPATLKISVDGTSDARVVKHAGTVRIRWPSAPRRVRAVAWDLAGNMSAPVVRRSRASP
jgi:hypothetical protein